MICPKRRGAGQSEVGPGWIMEFLQIDVLELFGMVWAVYVKEVPVREGEAVSIRGDNASVVKCILG